MLHLVYDNDNREGGGSKYKSSKRQGAWQGNAELGQYGWARLKLVLRGINVPWPDILGAYQVLTESGDALLFDETTANQTALRKWSVAEQGVAVGWFSRAPGFAPQRGTPLAV